MEKVISFKKSEYGSEGEYESEITYVLDFYLRKLDRENEYLNVLRNYILIYPDMDMKPSADGLYYFAIRYPGATRGSVICKKVEDDFIVDHIEMNEDILREYRPEYKRIEHMFDGYRVKWE